MRNRLFEFSRNHSDLTIDEEDGQIIFVETSCFDYNTGEWDTFVATISKSDFIKGVKEFLEKGVCKVGKLEMVSQKGNFYISLDEGDGCYLHSVEYWIHKPDTKQFLQMLKKAIEQVGLKNN